jgi:anti-anti-sigma factor
MTTMPPGDLVTKPGGRGERPLRFELAPSPEPGVAVLELTGDLDERALQPARDGIAAVLATRPELVLLALTGVTRLDSAGLVLLTAMRRYAGRAGAQLSIVDKNRIQARAGAAAALPVYSSVAVALRHRRRRRTGADSAPVRTRG